MFNQIGDLLKQEFLVVRFDYNKIISEENATYTFSFSTQAQILDSVITYANSNFNTSNLDIIAHSQGCLVTGLLSPEEVKTTVLLSSPILPPYQNMRDYFSKRTGTTFSDTSTSKIKRSDGSWTYIDPDFWPEAKNIDPINLYRNLADKTDLFFIHPLQDQVVTTGNYDQVKFEQGINYIELDGNHDFHPPHRQKLLDILETIFFRESH